MEEQQNTVFQVDSLEKWHDTFELRSDQRATAEVLNSLLKAQNDRGMLEGCERVYCGYMEQLSLHNACCPLCYRGFQYPNEALHLVSQLNCKVEGYLGMIAEKEREVEHLRERLRTATEFWIQKEMRAAGGLKEEEMFSPAADDVRSCHSSVEDIAETSRDTGNFSSQTVSPDEQNKGNQLKNFIEKESENAAEELFVKTLERVTASQVGEGTDCKSNEVAGSQTNEATNKRLEEVVDSQPIATAKIQPVPTHNEVVELRKTLQSLQNKISSKNQQIEQLVMEKSLLLKGRMSTTYGASDSQETESIPDVFPPHFLSDLRDESREETRAATQETDLLAETQPIQLLEGQDASYSCFICKETFTNNTFFSQHMLRKHSLSEKLLHMKGGEGADTKKYLYNCVLCKKGFDKKKSYQQHLRRKQHKLYLMQSKPSPRGSKSTKQSLNADDSTDTAISCEDTNPPKAVPKEVSENAGFLSRRERSTRASWAFLNFDEDSNEESPSVDTESNTCLNIKSRTRSVVRKKSKNQPDRETSEKGVHKCHLCEKSFSFPSRLNLHMSSHMGIKSISCKDCGKSFTRQQYLKRHCQSVHEKLKRHICETCGQGFTFKNILKVHMMTHTEIKPFVCGKCNKSFRRKSHLLLHESSVHDKIKAFVCSECGKQFVEKATLVAHENGHKGIRPFLCVICNKTFTSRHYLLIHEGVHSRPFKCGLCLRRFGQKTALIRHHLRHQGRKPVRKEYVRREIKSNNQYKCSICLKGFPVRQRLTIHELVHSGLKPYVCSKCGKCFSQKGHLKRHDDIMHQMVRPFICTVCGKAFSQKTNLHQHEQTHNPSEEKVACEICHKSYSNKYQLTKHQRMHLKESNTHLITLLP